MATVERELPVISDELAEHLATLLTHARGPDEDGELTVELYPKHCENCRRLREWAEGIAGRG